MPLYLFVSTHTSFAAVMIFTIMNLLPRKRNSVQYTFPIALVGGAEPSDLSHVMSIVVKELQELSTTGCDVVLHDSRQINTKIFLGCICADFEALVKLRDAFGKNATIPCGYCCFQPGRGIEIYIHAYIFSYIYIRCICTRYV